MMIPTMSRGDVQPVSHVFFHYKTQPKTYRFAFWIFHKVQRPCSDSVDHRLFNKGSRNFASYTGVNIQNSFSERARGTLFYLGSERYLQHQTGNLSHCLDRDFLRARARVFLSKARYNVGLSRHIPHLFPLAALNPMLQVRFRLQ
jgi:hypothetical protein